MAFFAEDQLYTKAFNSIWVKYGRYFPHHSHSFFDINGDIYINSKCFSIGMTNS